MLRQIEIFTLGFSALGVGVLIYVFDRQPEFIYFLPGWLSLNSQPGGFSAVSGIICQHFSTSMPLSC